MLITIIYLYKNTMLKRNFIIIKLQNSVDKLKDLYNIKNRVVDLFDQYLEMGSIRRATKILTQKLIVRKDIDRKNLIQLKKELLNIYLSNIIKLKKLK